MVDRPLLQIDGLTVTGPNTADRAVGPPGGPLIDGVSLRIEAGEVHAIVGPVGSGAAALAPALLGSPDLPVASGTILFRGDDITAWSTDVRAKAGLFLAFGQPRPIAGVPCLGIVQQALDARTVGDGSQLGVPALHRALVEWMHRLGIEPSPADGGGDGQSLVERRQNEILQMAMLEPELVILDDIDAGLDDAAVAAVAEAMGAVRAERPRLGTLAVTHCQRLLAHLEPDHVHLMVGGRIVASGGPELADRLQTEGYESFT